jgi:hypothetical protein
MNTFETTSLWKAAFLSRGTGQSDKTEQLRQAFLSFRERAKQLANEIHHHQPDFTVHDITHIDALWGVASLVVSDSFPMTPTEGFVLGGAFLVHDLAMTLAAYPKGIEELKRQPEWKDTIAILLQKTLGRAAAADELLNPGNMIESEATRILLRVFHAKLAEILPSAAWTSGSTTFHLIDNPDLREAFGVRIGRIAASHWWDTSRVEKEFKHITGAPTDCPNVWQVDELKLAALLRVADACHLDDRRAPSFLRALRKPMGVADTHWKFQNKLLQPRIDGERLVFTSKSSFSVDDSTAWWLCFDALQTADYELRRT